MADQNPQLGMLLDLERRHMAGDPAISDEQWNSTFKPRLDAFRAQGIQKPLASPADDEKLKADALAESLDKIEKGRSLIQRSRDSFLGTGFGSATAARIPGSTAADIAADNETLKNASALQRVMEVSKASGGRNPLAPLSNSDFQALSSSLTNLDPHNQSSEQYQKNVGQVLDMYTRMYQAAGGTDLESDLKALQERRAKAAGLPVSSSDAPPAGAPSAPGGADSSPPTDGPEGYNPNTGGFRVDVRKPAAPPPPIAPSSAIGAGLRGAVQGATLGFSDELHGLAAGLGAGLSGDNMGDAYNRAVDADRRRLAADREQHPYATLGGEIVGGLALPFAGEAAGLLRGAATVGRAARADALAAGAASDIAALAGARAATRRGILEGASYGAGYGAGTGDTLRDRALGAGAGGVAGAALGAGFGKLSELATGRAAGRGGGLPGGGAGGAGAPPTRNAVAEAAQRQGIEVMPADVGGVGTRMASGATAMTLGGIPMSEAAERSIASAGAARSRIAGMAGDATDEAGAGQAAQRGANAFISASERRAGQLYDAIPIAGDNQASLGNTRTALTELTNGMASNPDLSRLVAQNPRLRSFLDALTPKAVQVPVPPKAMPGGTPIPQTPVTEFRGGNLSWEDLKRFRSAIGEMIGQPSLADDTSTTSLRRLYGALSSDMEDTARAAGPKAFDAWKKADRYWRGRQDRIETVLTDLLGKDYRKGDEAAFAQIARWSKPGGDSARLSRAMRSIPKEEADTVRATVIERLGRASKGNQDETGQVFSPAQFVMQWNDLSPRAKAILFNDKSVRDALDDLAVVTSGMKGAQKYANISKTGNAVNGIALLSSLFASPVATAGVAGTQLAAGKLLSSQSMVRFLTRNIRAANEGKPRQEIVRDMLRRLPALASRNPAIAAEVGQIEQSLLRAVNDNASASRAAASGEEGRDKPN